ncbi:PHD finger protein 14-like isoform X2 [Gordionus sp. m RMFG-2023]
MYLDDKSESKILGESSINLDLEHEHSMIDNIPEVMVCMVCLCDNRIASEYLVECDVCGLVVHETCYGILPANSLKINCGNNINLNIDNSGKSSSQRSKSIAASIHPDKKIDTISNSSTSSQYSTEPWFCSPCRAAVKYPACKLCPFEPGIGAFKETDVKTWVHLICALYIPGVTFADVEHLSAVTLFELNYKRFGERECAYCENRLLSKTGICIKCDAGMCRTFFHVTCAQREGLLIENYNSNNLLKSPNLSGKNNRVKTPNNNFPNSGTNALSPESAYFAFCKAHHGDKTSIRKRAREFALARKRQTLIRSKSLKGGNYAGSLFYKKDLNNNDIENMLKCDDVPDAEAVHNRLKKRILKKLAISRSSYERERVRFGALLDNWIPTPDLRENYSRHLTSDPIFVDALLSKANVAGIRIDSLLGFGTFLDYTQDNSRRISVCDENLNFNNDPNDLDPPVMNLNDSRHNLPVLPAFSHKFITYFKARETELEKWMDLIKTKNDEIQKLKMTRDKLIKACQIAKESKNQSHLFLQSNIDSIKNIWNYLCLLKGHHSYTLPKRFQLLTSTIDPSNNKMNTDERSVANKITQKSKNVGIRSKKGVTMHKCCVCHICDETISESLIECDTCQKLYHMTCHDPPLKKKPLKSKFYTWQCSQCVENVSLTIDSSQLNNTESCNDNKDETFENDAENNDGPTSNVKNRNRKRPQRFSHSISSDNNDGSPLTGKGGEKNVKKKSHSKKRKLVINIKPSCEQLKSEFPSPQVPDSQPV